MEVLKRKRTQLRREFTILVKKFLDALSTGVIEKIEATFVATKETAEKLQVVEGEIMEDFYTCENFDENAFKVDRDKALEYEIKWAEVRAKYEIYVSASKPRAGSQAGSDFSDAHGSVTITKNLKIPKLQLAKFDGNVRNWIQYWGQFRKIHEDSNIDSLDKFQYLIQSTVEGSPAHQLVLSYPPSAGNYPKAVEALKERFARDDMLIETYVRGLLSLVWSQLKGESYTLSRLYDSLQTHLQALDTLKVTKDKFASILYPMIESALPEELLRSWNRLRSERKSRTGEGDDNLASLMNFLKSEVESEEHISLAREGFLQLSLAGTSSSISPSHEPPTACFYSNAKKNIPSSASSHCLWCDKDTHSSVECYKASRMSPKERLDFVKNKKACNICLKTTHFYKKCKNFHKCLFCKRRHVTIMCQNVPEMKTSEQKSESEKRSTELLSELKTTTLLQTLIVKLFVGNKYIQVRALIDTGAQRSYIKEELVKKLGLKATRIETLTHCLFGGVETTTKEHAVYDFRLESVCNNFSMKISALGQETICGILPKVRSDFVLEQLRQKGITLTDTTTTPDDVSILIGADYSGILLTGIVLQLENNLTAVQTEMGWTIQGPVTGAYFTTSTTVNLLCSSKLNITELWDLETLGIRDPSEHVSKKSQEMEVLQRFNETISINEENRYEVHLPWRDVNTRPEPNYEIAKKRLLSTTTRLQSLGKLEAYDEVFTEWTKLGIIEKSPCQTTLTGHFMPHHAVIRESSLTTKVRPVFDASARDKHGISINSCLEKGVNLIELIPNILIDFRKEAIGVTADIAKAFLQISLVPEDRDYLKFLWWSDIQNPDKKVTIYRHRRVVFGVTSSPFHLAATINYHLDRAPDDLKETAMKLKKSFYVDNCVTSVRSVDELNKFTEEAKKLMLSGMFDLRCWVTAPVKSDDTITSSVLGIVWNTNSDELSCNVSSIDCVNGSITKRTLLSVVHKVFDPIGLCCPTSIVPKMILQKAWTCKLSWDEELPSHLRAEFLNWTDQLHFIREIKIPRRLTRLDISICKNTLHVFCDASQAAYAVCAFLRSEYKNEVSVQLVMAKSRVTPAKKITIPRLELVAATLATRLTTTIVGALNLKDCPVHYWTDSSVVLCWLKGHGDWSVFVANRVKEIRKSSDKDSWRHVPGDLNPADLPSRGVGAKQLMKSKWWEGPSWLYGNSDSWPSTNFTVDSNELEKERKKSSIHTMLVETSFLSTLSYFSSYSKVVRMIGWMLRMKYKRPATLSHIGLTFDEIERAEKVLFRLIQAKHDKKISNLQTFVDKDSIRRLITRLDFTSDNYDFKSPVVLPANDEFVERLVSERHRLLQHAGTQTLMVNLREGFWIIGVRRLVKKIVRDCMICKRFKAKPCQTPPASLLKNRTDASAPFEVSGVDLAGPLLLKSRKKCWIALFTCATYRAVHLEVVESLSSHDFILALRRFIARRGRVRCIYSDNGTNFVGVSNLLNSLDWGNVVNFSSIRKINWIFSPPSAPWWGGFFERLVGVVKQSLVRVLGQASVKLIELQTVLCDCEATINNRPLTYVSTQEDDLKALTPQMFIQPLAGSSVGDLDEVDSGSLNVRARYCQSLRDHFRQRFRAEYLSFLIQKNVMDKIHPPLRVGDLVLVGTEDKRLLWPLGVIEETFTGHDGRERVAKVRTSKGYKVRPFRKLYPLELHHDSGDPIDSLLTPDSTFPLVD